MRAIVLVTLIALMASGCRDPRCDRSDLHGQARTAASEKVRAARAFQNQNAIGGVLQADAKTASFDDADARLAAMQSIDLRDCPADFRAAYAAHIQAWRNAALAREALRRVADGPGQSDPSQIRQKAELRRRARRADLDVRASFAWVKTVAASYDVSTAPAA